MSGRHLYFFMFKRVFIFISFLILTVVTSNSAFAYYQPSHNQIESTAYNAFFQELGTGLTGNIATITFAVYNNVGSTVSTNKNSFILKEYSSASPQYTGSSTSITPDSISCNPSNRCTGSPVSGITSGTEIVYVTASYTASFNASKYYLLGYFASNDGNRLKAVGSASDQVSGTVYYENGAVYTIFTGFGNHNVYYVNHLPTVVDLYYSVNGDLGQPTASITDNNSIDPINSTIDVNISGDLKSVGAHYVGDVKIYMSCTKTGAVSTYSTVPDVHVRVYADDCDTTTHNDGVGEYVGYNYCVSPSSTVFNADHVKLPYKQGYDCTYDMTYDIYQRSCVANRVNGVVTGGATCTSTKVSDGTLGDNFAPNALTSGVDSTLSGEPDKADPLAWIAWKFKEIMVELFSFNNIDTDLLLSLKQEVQERAPFAYAYSVFNMDFTSYTLGATTLPVMTYASANLEGNYISNSIIFNSVVDDTGGGIANMLTTIRPFLQILLWGGFVVYIVSRVRNLVIHL